MRRIVVTGYGMINCVGNNANDSFLALLNGESGIDNISYFDTSTESVKIAGEVKNFNPSDIMNSKDIKKTDRFIHLGIHTISEAIKRANLNIENMDAESIGVCAATGIGGLPMIQQNVERNAEGQKITPFFIPGTITNMLAGYASIYFNLKGPNLTSTTACTAGLHAITQAVKTLKVDTSVDTMVVVGSESTISSMGIKGFSTMKALSTRNDDPKTASRPFDKDRDGFVMGEGAACLILETYEHAKERNAQIYAEITGFGETADAEHITAPSIDGPVRAIRKALNMANNPIIDYINAHGTSTSLGDINETNAFKEVFSSEVPPISSIKGSTGHCLGATGIIEAVVSIMALNKNIMPPTINQFQKDEKCDLDYIPNVPREKNLKTVMSTNYGFGGTNGAIIFSKI